MKFNETKMREEGTLTLGRREREDLLNAVYIALERADKACINQDWISEKGKAVMVRQAKVYTALIEKIKNI